MHYLTTLFRIIRPINFKTPLDLYFTILIVCILPLQLFPQSFTRITSGAIVTNGGNSGGSNWVDVNQDGWLDLFVANGNDIAQQNFLYLGSASGEFTRITDGDIVTDAARSIGGTWGDYDNDGDPDLFVANRGNQDNALYENNGDGSFSKITSGAIVTDGGDSNISHWLDIDNDGDLDLYVLNFNQANFLYRNDDGSFIKVTTGSAVTDVSPSISCVWADYDNDLDLDLFMSNGGNQNNVLYRNNGDFTFDKTVFSDGNSSLGGSWGDYDNDGDLDLFVANFLDQNNLLYKNEGAPDYTLTRITTGDIVNDGGRSVGTAWGDYDNDGDLDLYVGNHTQNNFYYANNGDGSFSKISSGDFVTNGGNTFGVSNGDFNRDGSLDIFAGNISNQNNDFYQNDGNAGHWARIICKGMTSNRSAIGTQVRIKAVIAGGSRWQMREISAQTGYNSQNETVAHFGLGDAGAIDSLLIQWPSGIQDIHTNLAVDGEITVAEGGGVTGLSNFSDQFPEKFALHPNFPNPFNPETIIRYEIPAAAAVEIIIYNIAGETVRTLVQSVKEAGLHQIKWDGRDHFGRPVPSGVYVYRLRSNEFIAANKMHLLR